MSADGVPIAIDPGSAYVKFGRAAEGVIPHLGPPYTAQLDDSHVVGKAAWDAGREGVVSGALDGAATDWAAVERVWEYCFKELHAIPCDQPLLLVASSDLSPAHRERVTQLAFETFNVPSLYIASHPVLTLHASGATSGLVVDLGYRGCRAVPVFDGLCIRYAAMRSPVGGRALSAVCESLLTKRYCKPVRPPTLDALREALALVAPKTLSPGDKPNAELARDFQLPDGETVTFSSPERLLLGEALFHPTVVGITDLGIPGLLLHAVEAAEPDQRGAVGAHVAVAGGTSLTPGFTARLQSELELQWPDRPDVRLLTPADGHLSAWNGAAILSSLNLFHSLWITKQQYNDHGPSIVHRRCA